MTGGGGKGSAGEGMPLNSWASGETITKVSSHELYRTKRRLRTYWDAKGRVVVGGASWEERRYVGTGVRSETEAGDWGF